MSELKPCPFCGEPADDRYNRLAKCSNKSCLMNHWVDDEDFFIDDDWNTRPIEDALRARIAELEADNKKAFDLVRKLRMYCIWANWDNPDTEDEFNEFDVEVCKWLSKFMEREE